MSAMNLDPEKMRLPEQAAKELINGRWEKVTGDKLPAASAARLG